MLEMVHAELGTDLGEELVPMVNGGAQLHKIFGLMHDTRSTANRVAVLMAELRERKARSFHGDAAWDAADPCEPVVRDPMTGHFVVPHNVKVPDSNVTITRALQGYCLAEYPNGIDTDPTYFPWVQHCNPAEIPVTLPGLAHQQAIAHLIKGLAILHPHTKTAHTPTSPHTPQCSRGSSSYRLTYYLLT
jgi:hypothetical protein